jgi:nucleotide-binding universal stress UspA family protein
MGATILLATDGSEHGHRAAERAIELAAEREGELHVLCVVDRRVVDEPGLSSAEAVTIDAEDHGHDCVEEICQRAAEREVAAAGETRHGVPHELILDHARDIDADVIVIGEHGDHHTHLGGVGEKVLARSDREVVVVGSGD